MPTASIHDLAGHVLDAWNSQDVERVVETYAQEFSYVDPDTRGAITDRDALRRFLTKLFANVRAHTTAREALPLSGGDGVALLWSATVSLAAGDKRVEVDGVDIVRLDGERIADHQIYFDRAALAPLL
jgi:hypothetical protein